ncbi:MAG TPA: ABC transporter ATP-binding protein/permease [Clostridia bacterium]|nr:ABC transporter ATP-binding protein/permease [Clostridia bacterium]
MLKLVDIKKEYISGSKYSKEFPLSKVEALKGVTLEFRPQEFVAVLGPSGCGKTTLLNVIGGLDQYTSGELYINNQSTKHFTDYEWDKYRNGQIGFVFQNYNLIMHQTVLSNVEMALTLIGVSKSERKRRAIAALESVGLGDQIHKNPNQLSGGQMQRVAIARAIINDPKIILADEPTGALDSESSIQVMDILKKLSEDRLIIMVTHNNELAEQYASRIVRLVDGKVIADSNPYESDFKEDTELVETSKNPFKRLANKVRRNKKRAGQKTPHMSYASSFKLSLSNLNTKKARTALTSFAGSIGIIGIALVLAISSGFSNYITSTEESALSRYPIAIQKEGIDSLSMSSILNILSKTDKNKQKYPNIDGAYVGKFLGNVTDNISTIVYENDLERFKAYVDEYFDSTYASVKYNYQSTLHIYSNYLDENDYIKVNPFDDIMDQYIPEFLKKLIADSGNNFVSSVVKSMSVWDELISNENLLRDQYDIVGSQYGSRWPQNKHEVVLVLDEYNQIPDYMVLAIGLLSPDKVMDVFNPDSEVFKTQMKFEDLIGLKYRVMSSADYYYQDENGAWKKYETTANLPKDYIEENSIEIEVVGIVRPNERCKAPSINGAIGYTKELSDYIIQRASAHPAVKAQQESPDHNIVDGFDLSKKEDYDNLMVKMGVADLNKPSSIMFYVTSFESKDRVIEFIDGYNDYSKLQGKHGIKYTDTLGAMIASINEISNAITRVLIAFSAISLIVSSIMIGIITYISVLERTKEIGVLRSLGARKKDISRVFSAETMIIGFISGLIGVSLTYVFSVPINTVLEKNLGIKAIANLVWWQALILIAMSIGLTVISGFIPSRIASKKDPVKALRSE